MTVNLSKCASGPYSPMTGACICAYHLGLYDRENERWYDAQVTPEVTLASADQLAAGFAPLVYVELEPYPHGCFGCGFCEGGPWLVQA